MASVLRELLVTLIRENGPITVAVFMEAALYHPGHGYYATEARRSGRGGDFYTSVDAGSLFGETLAGYLARRWIEMARPDAFDLVEAGAGNGRLARDVADAAAREYPDFYETLRLHLVERSADARLEAGWRAEVNLLAPRWIEEAASAIRAGELLVFDYGHQARELYSAAHASGTLVSYHRHLVDADWLADPGERDLTAHVDF